MELSFLHVRPENTHISVQERFTHASLAAGRFFSGLTGLSAATAAHPRPCSEVTAQGRHEVPSQSQDLSALPCPGCGQGGDLGLRPRSRVFLAPFQEPCWLQPPRSSTGGPRVSEGLLRGPLGSLRLSPRPLRTAAGF